MKNILVIIIILCLSFESLLNFGLFHKCEQYHTYAKVKSNIKKCESCLGESSEFEVVPPDFFCKFCSKNHEISKNNFHSNSFHFSYLFKDCCQIISYSLGFEALIPIENLNVLVNHFDKISLKQPLFIILETYFQNYSNIPKKYFLPIKKYLFAHISTQYFSSNM